MLVAICNINSRQYCAGVFTNLAHAVSEFAGAYTIEEIAKPANDPFAASASRVFDCMDTGIDRDHLPSTFAGFIGTDADGFTLYEYIDATPGYVPFDED